MDTLDMTVVSDVVLLQRIARREEAAVGQLYDRHSIHLCSLLCSILRDRGEAEDALQETFLRVWERVDSYNESLGAPVVWMTRIARNLAIDKLRSKLGQARKAEDDLSLHEYLHADQREASPEHLTQQAQRQQHIAGALASLTDEQRVLIEYAYFQGYTQSELAEHFKLPLGTVKTRVRAGMSKLRQQLEHLSWHIAD